MRPSSRLLVPALTIFCWSFESTYASFRPPGRSLYRRQFRTADYSTSIRSSHNPSNGVKLPETDTSSAPRSGSDAPQTSVKTRRLLPYHPKSQLLGSAQEKRPSYREDRTYIESYDGPHSDHGLSPYPYAQAFGRRHPPPTNAGHNFHSIHVRDALHKRTTPSAAQHKSRGMNDEVTSHSLDNHEKRLDSVRRSASIDLNTLHIARGIQKPQPRDQTVKSQPRDEMISVITV
ncbi:hypothetical protein C0989_011507 [Termitomyces sp. Mn162]|nr:hypothetical protein C0989_011507 [Termitomyces sp. Mn162]